MLAGVETPAHPPSPPLFLLPSLELLGFPTRFWHKSLTKSLQTFQETLPRLLPRWLWMWKGSLCALCFIQHTYFIAAMLMSLCIWICKKKTLRKRSTNRQYMVVRQATHKMESFRPKMWACVNVWDSFDAIQRYGNHWLFWLGESYALLELANGSRVNRLNIISLLTQHKPKSCHDLCPEKLPDENNHGSNKSINDHNK